MTVPDPTPGDPRSPDPEGPGPDAAGPDPVLPAGSASDPPLLDPAAPFHVFGLQLVVRMLRPEDVSLEIQCPQGHPIQYGTVLATGDGFDPQANRFRSMPLIGSTVAFEETVEGVEGHYFFLGEDEFRVLHLEVITIAFPPAEEA